MLTPLMTPWKAKLPLGFSWNEPAGIVTEKGPICRVTSSVRGLIPLLFAPRVKDSFRSKPWGGPAVMSSLAEDVANGVPQLSLLGEKVIGSPSAIGSRGKLSSAKPEKLKAPVRGPSGFVSVVLKIPFAIATPTIESLMVIGEPGFGVAVLEYLTETLFPGGKTLRKTEMV